ncbi:MCE family protein [Gluconacetobacter diazotrophicus]|uniref:MCE family protein n=1 Tax=Gluconacetobacter diazotrophicus TaxID=33996 RepID=A0A7W4I401_GLUDI|nr:MlaD family protein [Gluconacetobacter diazotrophicus]MBB2155613.1 MCE family protein [Gluconacetobacter diazotrophicus]
MTRQPTALAVLLFILCGIGTGIAILGSFGRFGLLTRTERALVVFDTPVPGLSAGAPVTFRGVALGRVEQVNVLPDPARGRTIIPVTIRVRPDLIRVIPPPGTSRPRRIALADLVRDGLQAHLHSQSLVVGRSGIDLDFAPGPSPPPHPGLSHLIEIPARESHWQVLRRTLATLPIHAMAAQWQQARADGRNIATRMDATLPPMRAGFLDVRDRAHATAAALNRAETQTGRAWAVTHTDIDHLQAAARRQVHDRGAEMSAVAQGAHAAMTEARQVRADLRALDADTARTDLAATGRDIAAAGAALHDAARTVRRTPGVLLVGEGK